MTIAGRGSWAGLARLGRAAVVAAAALAATATAASAGIVIAIDKSAQKMTVAVDGVQKYVWPVSTGAPGYTTPSGRYQPFRMEPDHFSKEWDDAPMPHSIFFTHQGHAIHGSFSTRTLGRAVSHGCVRLAPANAATLYQLVEKRGIYATQILIQDRAGERLPATAVSTAPKKKKKQKLSPLWRLYQ